MNKSRVATSAISSLKYRQARPLLSRMQFRETTISTIFHDRSNLQIPFEKWQVRWKSGFFISTIKYWKSVDVLLAIRTRVLRMVGSEGSTELWRPQFVVRHQVIGPQVVEYKNQKVDRNVFAAANEAAKNFSHKKLFPSIFLFQRFLHLFCYFRSKIVDTLS